MLAILKFHFQVPGIILIQALFFFAPHLIAVDSQNF